MRDLLQDNLRSLVGRSLIGLGRVLQPIHRRKLRRWPRAQEDLRRRYEIRPETPILEWGPELRALVARFDGTSVETSGSTSEPKRIAYPPSRVRAVKWAFIEAFSRAYAAIEPPRQSLYVFSALEKDRSLTSLLLEEKKLPPYVSSLQAPYRVHGHPAMRALAAEYGATAARLFVIATANPGVFYATNPSTLCAFFEELETHWTRVTRLIRERDRLPAQVQQIARRLRSRGCDQRLAKIASSDTPLPIEEIAPDLCAYACWTGGYVAPFLRKLEQHLPGCKRIEMYSMSTETIETLPHYENGDVAFLPIAPGVFYEFLPENAADEPHRLVRELEPGKKYTMVVSDAYGLRRYQTADLFECRRIVHGLPDLRFVARRGLAYSFTGEKLTADQASEAFARTKIESFAALIPSLNPSPHYRLVVAGDAPENIAEEVDRALAAINQEYAGKRASGRLGPIAARKMNIEALAVFLGGERPWESQLKLLPLYTKTWEELENQGAMPTIDARTPLKVKAIE